MPVPDAVPPSGERSAPCTFRVRAPEDFFAFAPIMIGFEPEDSIVMLTFGGHTSFHARIDLPPRRVLTPTVTAELADTLLEPVLRHRVRDLVLLFYSDDRGATTRAFRALRRRCRAAGIGLVEALRTDGRRYYPLLATDADLRTNGVAYDVTDHPFAAEAVVQGRVVHRSRAAMAAQLDPLPPAVTAVERILAQPEYAEDPDLAHRPADLLEAGAWIEDLVRGHVAARTLPADDDVAELAWLVQVTRLRDAAWGTMRREDARQHLELWIHVLRRTPEHLVPPVAALAGWAAWLAGDGALAWAAVDRCTAVDPDYGLAGLLGGALSRAVPPELGEPTWDWWAGLSDGPPRGPGQPRGPVPA